MENENRRYAGSPVLGSSQGTAGYGRAFRGLNHGPLVIDPPPGQPPGYDWAIFPVCARGKIPHSGNPRA